MQNISIFVLAYIVSTHFVLVIRVWYITFQFNATKQRARFTAFIVPVSVRLPLSNRFH